MKTITLDQPGDVLAMVPYLLGFHPEESVVAVLTRRRQVVLTMRLDLPALSTAEALGVRIADLCEQHHADELMLVGYSSRAGAARELLERVAGQIDDVALVRLVDVVYVDGERWWSLRCAADCCPAGGRPYAPDSHPVAAEAVYAGLATRRDRASLVAEVAGPPKADRRRLRRLGDRAAAEFAALDRAARCAIVTDLVRRGLEGSGSAGPGLEAEELVRLAVLMRDLVVRDLAWSMITYEAAEAHRELWRRVVAHAVAPDECGPLCLLGLAAWIGGDGALLNCCIDRVAGIDRNYSLADLLGQISDGALSPKLWADLGPAIRDELAEFAEPGAVIT